MKPAFALPLALAFAFLLAVPVFAAAPVIETGSFYDDHLAYANDSNSPCPGIEIWDRESGTYRTTTYFDNQGNVVRVQIHFNGTDNFYNPAKPGFELSGQFAATTDVDLSTGAFVFARGVPYHITVPGYGTVLVRAGQWQLQYPNGQIAGKNSLLDPKDMAQFCSLLR